MHDHDRPDPDALLAQIRREENFHTIRSKHSIVVCRGIWQHKIIVIAIEAKMEMLVIVQRAEPGSRRGAVFRSPGA